MSYPEPEEFHSLPWLKKVNTLTGIYGKKCCTSYSYWPIRKHFEQQEIKDMQVLYDYLYSLPDKTLMTLTEVYNQAEIYRQKLQLEREKAKSATLPQYKSLMDCLADM